MADGIEFKLEGVDSLLGKLEAITKETKRKTGRSALRKAGNVIVTQIKRNAERLDDPHTARSIADNAALRWNGRMFKQTGDLAFRIGILQGAVLKNTRARQKMLPPRTGVFWSLELKRWRQNLWYVLQLMHD